MPRGIDRCFLQYGIRQEDMNVIESACNSADIDFEWLKENVLKPFNEERNSEKADEKKVKNIIKTALKRVQ